MAADRRAPVITRAPPRTLCPVCAKIVPGTLLMGGAVVSQRELADNAATTSGTLEKICGDPAFRLGFVDGRAGLWRETHEVAAIVRDWRACPHSVEARAMVRIGVRIGNRSSVDSWAWPRGANLARFAPDLTAAAAWDHDLRPMPALMTAAYRMHAAGLFL